MADNREKTDGRVVGVVVNAMGGYSRNVIRGIAPFAASRGWTLRVEGVNVGAIDAGAQEFDGLIVQASTEEDAERFRRAAVPVVNVSSALEGPGLPTVITDDAAVGRLGADHLLRLWYRSLAFYAPDGRAFAKLRHEGFGERCREAGLAETWIGDEQGLVEALDTLPRPVGVMGVNDRSALQVLEVCRRLGGVGVRVPDDVAVLGVDDDDLVQSLAYPPLSTVNTARDRVGFEAAAMLEGLMGSRETRAAGRWLDVSPGGEADGEDASRTGGTPMPSRAAPRVLVAPKGVVGRRSTDATAIADPDVAEAARWIHANAGKPISVTDVTSVTAVSRRQLERRFRSATGRSILDEIVRCRVDRARGLLIDTELTLSQVSQACGFSSVSYFCAVFRKNAGLPPQKFRQRFRQKI